MPSDDLDRLQRALAELPAPSLAPGFDARVIDALRHRAAGEAQAATMGRQFWRLAPAVLAVALILAVVAIRRGSTSRPAEPVTLASWYPISADPTEQP